MTIKRILILLITLLCFSIVKSDGTINGFKGIWYTLTQFGEYGDKYSGGLGTYTAKHLPLAVYSAAANKTFFTYSGTTSETENHLLIMVSYYDHSTGKLARPVILLDKNGASDAHDNATIQVDSDGYIWIFISGRYSVRNGYIYKSNLPCDISGFSEVLNKPFNYPQPHYLNDKGFLFLFTNIGTGRELYVQTSLEGANWTVDKKLVGFGGHYQISSNHNGQVGFAYNWHPNGNVDRRTNLYYMETKDMGVTWSNINGEALSIPVSSSNNISLVKDYSSLGLNVYLKDIGYNEKGYPVILYITSPNYLAGPANPLREWRIAQWNGSEWLFSKVTDAFHNYDMGSLYLNDVEAYRIMAPTDMGPQKWGAGGEMVIWESYDEGLSWNRLLNITHESARNHTYARRPQFCHSDFYAFWADGNTEAFSRSCLYFANVFGDVYQMPYDLSEDLVDPIPFEEIQEEYPQVLYSSTYNNGFPAIKLIDSVIADESSWEVSNFPQSVIIDYGEEKYFNTAMLYTQSNRSYNYKVELSNDMNFIDGAVVNRNGISAGSSPFIDWFNPIVARYAKLTITGQNNVQDNCIKIKEFQLANDIHSGNFYPDSLHVRVFPNPVSQNYFTIDRLNPGSEIEIYTAGGIKIHQAIAYEEKVIIDCSAFSNGLVLVNIVFKGYKRTIKVMINK